MVPGDIILEFQGKPVRDQAALAPLVQAVTPGTTVEVVLWRQGSSHTLHVTLGSVPDAEQQAGQEQSIATSPGMIEAQVQALVDALEAAEHQNNAEQIMHYFAPEATVTLTMELPIVGQQTQHFTRDEFYHQLKQGAPGGGLLEMLETHRLRRHITPTPDGQRATVVREARVTARVMGNLLHIRTEERLQVERVQGTFTITTLQSSAHIEEPVGLDTRRQPR